MRRFHRLGWIFVCALLWACETDPGLGTDPDAGPGADAASGADATAPDPDAAPELQCDDLYEVIDLAGQLAANSEANRGEYPLVLGHGFFGFDSVGPLEYFGGAADALRDEGFAAYVTAVEPIASSVDTRGPQLGREIACIATISGSGKVNLVGHSQGGLDARVVAVHPVYSQYVASVTTVATPHHGSLIADAALGLVPDVSQGLLDAIADLWGYIAGAPENNAEVQASLEQLSEAHSTDFNLTHPDNPSLEYFSWAGRSVATALSFDYGDEECNDGVLPNPPRRDIIDTELFPTFEFLNLLRGRNDGLVTIRSAKWGTFMGCVPADHADQIGLLSLTDTNPFSGFNHKEFFVQIAEDLESRGY